ncbi:heparan-sulfate 6-O-sulfotransferase 3-like isoform X2 [Watersipora subatra]|uniref:heparan-sulfate 6-O-sulfotransferase 3-like isoform X2 n=1 Tax=Watersipora subatra TaxID=2589382 RepID=UPI00355ACF5E
MKSIKQFLTLVTLLCGATILYILVSSTKNRDAIIQPVTIHHAFTEDIREVKSNGTVLGEREDINQVPIKYNFSLQDLHRHFAFSTDSPIDVLVFIHIQKTGGTTFGKNLVTNLDVRNPCQCTKPINTKLRCPCFASDGKRQWLFSRYSTGWMCGLHADLTEWTECLRTSKPDQVENLHRQRRYLLLTTLRDPIERYISEYMHTNRGATWSGMTLKCNGRSATAQEVPLCFNESWEGVRLLEFLSCPYNLANNRQTRMLANLSLVDCYDNFASHSWNKDLILESAKNNLRNLAFFALKEFSNESQYLFEHTFNLRFKQPLSVLRPKTIHETRDYFDMLKPTVQQQIRDNNDLDIQLYDYAKQLFFARYNFTKSWNSKLKFNDGQSSM